MGCPGCCHHEDGQTNKPIESDGIYPTSSNYIMLKPYQAFPVARIIREPLLTPNKNIF